MRTSTRPRAPGRSGRLGVAYVASARVPSKWIFKSGVAPGSRGERRRPPPDVQLVPVDAHDRPAERAHALIDVGPRAPAAGAAPDHPPDLLLAPLDPPA